MKGKQREIKWLMYLVFFSLFMSGRSEGGCLSSQNASEIRKNFSQANDFYRQGSYDRAITTYEQILGSRYESANVFYNLGNCYFKKGQLGRALLYYERGLRLAPRDREILFNRNLSISRIDGYRNYASGSWMGRICRALSNTVTIDEATVFLVLIYVAFSGLVIACLIRRSFSGARRVVLALLAALFLLGSGAMYAKIDHLNKDSIIIAKQVAAKFEPFDQATTFFELREGTPVILLETKESWMKIRRLDGKSGWVPSATVGHL